MSFSGFSEDDIKKLKTNKQIIIFENGKLKMVVIKLYLLCENYLCTAKHRSNNKKGATTAKSQAVKNNIVNKSLPEDNNNLSNNTKASVENGTEIIKSETNLISDDNKEQAQNGKKLINLDEFVVAKIM